MSNEEMAERIRRIEARLFGSDYVVSTDKEFETTDSEPEKKEGE